MQVPQLTTPRRNFLGALALPKWFWSLLLFALLAGSPIYARDYEIDFQRRFCEGMLQNRQLPNGTEVDCISDSHAIEVDFTEKWAEAIGQSLQYASQLSKLPGIILVCRSDDSGSLCLKHRYLIEQTMSYWRVGMTLWLCESKDAALADCLREEICGPDEKSPCDVVR